MHDYLILTCSGSHVPRIVKGTPVSVFKAGRMTVTFHCTILRLNIFSSMQFIQGVMALTVIMARFADTSLELITKNRLRLHSAGGSSDRS